MATTPVQTSYSNALTPAFAGMRAAYRLAPVIVSGMNNDSVSMPFGWGVARDTTLSGAPDMGAKMPGATTDKFFGITLHSHSYSRGPVVEIDNVGVVPGVMLSILREGRVWAVAELGCTPGDRLYVRCTAAGAGKGSLLNADPGGGVVLATTGKIGEWQTSAAATALAIVEVHAGQA